jgi:uncharacterized protein with von Willebrand factor type A (vWA) domain
MSVILDFIEMLRYFGLPISPSETITAQQAYEILGVTDQKILQYGLKAAILKRHEDNEIFNTCYNEFFVRGSNDYIQAKEVPHERIQFLQRLNRSSNEIDSEIGQLLVENQIEEAVQTTMAMMQGEGGVGSGSSFNQQIDEMQRRLNRSFYRTFGLEVPIRGLTPAQRMELPSEVISLAANLQQFFSQLNQHQDLQEGENQQITEDISSDRPEDLFQVNMFLTQDLATVSATMGNVKEHLLEIGKILASKERRRRRRAKQGKLDFRRTMRKNLKNNGIPIELVQKHKQIQDPEIIILNDVSGSTRWIADWFFVITYTAQQVFRKIRVLEFDNTMVDVTPALKQKTITQALKKREECWKKPLRTRRIHSDYQDSLEDFFVLTKFRPVNRRTSILILGDCRDFEGGWQSNQPISSYLIKKIVLNAKEVLILNPESETLWDAGDSVVKYYQAAGARVFHVATLKDLLTFVYELKKIQ